MYATNAATPNKQKKSINNIPMESRLNIARNSHENTHAAKNSNETHKNPALSLKNHTRGPRPNSRSLVIITTHLCRSKFHYRSIVLF